VNIAARMKRLVTAAMGAAGAARAPTDRLARSGICGAALVGIGPAQAAYRMLDDADAMAHHPRQAVLVVLLRGAVYRRGMPSRKSTDPCHEVGVAGCYRWSDEDDHGVIEEQAEALRRMDTHLLDPLRSSGWRLLVALSAYTSKTLQPVLLRDARASVQLDVARVLESAPGPAQTQSIRSDLLWALDQINSSACGETPTARRACAAPSVLLVRVDLLLLRTVTQLPSPRDVAANRAPAVLLPLPVCGHAYPDGRPLTNIWHTACGVTHQAPRFFEHVSKGRTQPRRFAPRRVLIMTDHDGLRACAIRRRAANSSSCHIA
jgi:hypothetical protein